MNRKYFRLKNLPSVTAGLLYLFMSVSIPTFANNDWCEFVNKKTGTAEIMLHGYIGKWRDVQETQFISALKRLEQDNTVIKVSLNSGGGDVFGGNMIYNAFKDSSASIEITVDGIAASMGGVVLQGAAKGKRRMQKNAKLMIHRITGGASGDADKMREVADMMEDLEEDIAGLYAEGKGESVEWVKNNWLKSGQDKWMNAKQALENGLIDEIVNEKPVKAPPQKIMNDPTALWKFYNEQLTTVDNSTTNTVNMERELMAVKLGLSKDATWDEINAAMDKLKGSDDSAKVKELQDELDKIKEGKVKTLIENAVKDKKITADQKEAYEKLADADYDSTVSVLEGLVPQAKPTSMIDEPGSEAKTEAADSSKWDFYEYSKRDPKGLNKMRLEDKDKYEALQASYDPSKPTSTGE